MTHAATPKRRTRGATHEDNTQEEVDSNLQPPPPDGGWGWVVVFASFAIHIVADGVTYSFGVFYLEFLHYFNEGKGATAWIASILVGVTLCSGPISSSFVNKYGCRAVTIAGSFLAGACLVLSVFARSVLTLYFTIGLGTGFGFGLIYLPAIVSVTCYFEKKRSLATGIAVCGSGLGTFVFAPLTEHLIVEYGWRGAMLIIAGLVLNCAILGALFRPVPDVRESKPVSKTASACVVTYQASSDTTDLHAKKDIAERDLRQEVSNRFAQYDGDGLHRPLSIGHFMIPHIERINSKPKTATSNIARLALSQPVLMTTCGSTSDHRSKLAFGSQSLRKSSGIMYRRDIFYHGSLHNIPYHRSNQWLQQDVKHTTEVHQLMELDGNKGSKQRQVEDDGITICGCLPCSKETRDTLAEMLDFSLLKDPIFILFTVSNFCTSIGFNIPYVYIVAQAEERGIPTDKASLLLAVIGIANLVGRIILGYISDKPWINRLIVYNTCLTICGVATAFSALCYDFSSFVIYGFVFGFTIGAYVGLTSVILVDLLGLDRLTNAFGLLLLFQGIASLLGPPIAGWLYDALCSYNPGFYVSGVTIAASGVMLFFIPTLQRYVMQQRINRSNQKSAVHQNGNSVHSLA
jgi:MFS family permease